MLANFLEILYSNTEYGIDIQSRKKKNTEKSKNGPRDDENVCDQRNSFTTAVNARIWANYNLENSFYRKKRIRSVVSRM